MWYFVSRFVRQRGRNSTTYPIDRNDVSERSTPWETYKDLPSF
jgi:hypothetical protein